MSDNIQAVAHDPNQNIAADVERIVRELAAAGSLSPGQLLVIGTSTSEVLGQRIGTSGTVEAAAQIFAGVEAARRDLGFYPVFQCCEHLNRALVVNREAAEKYSLEIVAAVPVPKAGGSMAAYAFRHLQDAVLVETVSAHGGIDIGDTFIGMHLRRVAVPVRPSIRKIGEAHVTMAFARPKLIGGVRAVYSLEAEGGAGGGGLAIEQSPGTCD
ncbi:TIGR01440 family protein [Paenibacillus sp. NEAU-GSW1]|uniref:TIGR01440 family protein n=1 Tax=Paenibacillus sp. NEAU-GSW1 TaxID=2682486 RepID=UPI0012E153BC|nr:TIGR01440 family protein [Paenibacillus sp. NEAU-GSW1]MUT65098.1 TIGR01440 family protein [Paenibacillus sp. NEAU-GSW1]